MRILIIEDDADMIGHIATGLAEAGHEIDCAISGDQGLRMADKAAYDVVVLDRMLPGMDGLAIVTEMRRRGDATPVLFLTTLGGLDDRVAGLNAGGDDYLAKPFALAELAARVAALGRRRRGGAAEHPPTILRHADIEVDLLARIARRGGRDLDLLPREMEILAYLVRNAGQVVTKAMLLEHVWEFHFDPQTTLVETHMSRLRAKLDKDAAGPSIQTVRGAGYCLVAP